MKCVQSWSSYSAARTYFLVVFVGLFFLGLVTTIVLYTIIIVKIKQKKETSGEAVRRSKEAQERKLLRVVIAITMVFFACFFPQAVLIVLAPVHAIPICHAEALRLVAKVMEQTYGAVNPILCMAFSSNYRSGFISVFVSCYRSLTSPCHTKTLEFNAEVQTQRGSQEPIPAQQNTPRNYDEPPRELVTRNIVLRS